MSHSKYKTFLIIFVGLFVTLIIWGRYVDIDDILKYGALFSLWLLLWLSLFFFLLYAQKTLLIKDYKGRFAPSNLFSSVALGIIISSIAYPIGMSVSYKIWNSYTDKYVHWEKISDGLKDTAHNNKSAASRLNAAADHYIHFGKEIYYLDEKNQNHLYSPDKSAAIERMKFIKTENKSKHLKLFMLFSSIISLLSGMIVAFVYLRYRKVKSRIAGSGF